MKRIITAIGNEELNHILKRQKEILIESSDIQYQEGILEALDKYPETDIVILYENIIGEIELEDLIRSIVIIKNDIEIILIVDSNRLIENKEVVKIVDNKPNYVDVILEYLSKKENIKIERDNLYKKENIGEIPIEEIMCKNENMKKEHPKMSNMKQITKKISKKAKRSIQKKEIFTIIGNYGSRENNILSNIIKSY